MLVADGGGEVGGAEDVVAVGAGVADCVGVADGVGDRRVGDGVGRWEKTNVACGDALA